MAGGPLVERRAEGEHDVGGRHQLGGERGGEAAGDAEREGKAGEQAVGHRRGGEQRARLPRQRLERLARARQHRAASGDQQRALGRREHPRGTDDRLLGRGGCGGSGRGSGAAPGSDGCGWMSMGA